MKIDLTSIKARVFRGQTLIFVFCAIILFSAGWLIKGSVDTPSNQSESEGEVTNQYRFYDGVEDDVSFQQFWQVWDLVHELYLRQPLSE